MKLRALPMACAVLVAVGTTNAQEWSDPNGGAGFFVPALSGIEATTLCMESGCVAGGAAFYPLENIQLVSFSDALGKVYRGLRVAGQVCIPGEEPLYEYRIVRGLPSGSNVEVLGYFRDRCSPDSIRRIGSEMTMGFDMANGIVYLMFFVSTEVQGRPEEGTRYVVSLSGPRIPTLLDIILSYQPPSTLSFNVPVRPEGLPGADSFSVYHGDVRTASDLSQATPLECSVPAGRPPVPGEHLTVADPLPDPAPGDARYYVAAVNHQGQRRAGRTSMNGAMQGRNAAALPGCP